MGVDRIAPGIGGGDLGDGAIDGPYAAAVRRDLDDRILGDRADCLALPYLGIVGAAIDRLDNDIMAVGDFVGQPALDHAADKRPVRRRGVITNLIDDSGRVRAPPTDAPHSAAAVPAPPHTASRGGQGGRAPPPTP